MHSFCFNDKLNTKNYKFNTKNYKLNTKNDKLNTKNYKINIKNYKLNTKKKVYRYIVKNNLTFYDGFKGALPIALGYMPVAFAFGILAIEKGLPMWSPVLISLSSFTGTGQFVGVRLIASGAYIFEIAFTIFIINIRYLLMSLSLSQKIPDTISLWQRLVIAFGNTDEVFAVAMQQKKILTFKYMLGLISCAYIGWNFGTVIGAFASTALPMSVRTALGITIYAMFIAIIIPPATQMKPIAEVIIIAIIISCIFKWLPFLNKLSSGWIIIICGMTAAAFGAYFHPDYMGQENS